MRLRSDQPFRVLVRHFFAGLFRFGVFNEAGAASLVRMILGVCAALLAFGLLLLRMFAGKYSMLDGGLSPMPYRHAVVADHAFLIATPMWLAGFVMLLLGDSLYPGATEFRVLMPLPVTRRLIFGAKLVALALFCGLLVGTTHVALEPMFLLTSVGPWAEHSWLRRAFAYETASLLGSVFAILAIAAAQGALLVVPGRRLVAVLTVIRSGLMVALMLALPLVGRLPGQGGAFAAGAWWLPLAPPAWFAGLEGWVGGTAEGSVRLAALAGLGLTVAGAITATSYWRLYRCFDRVLERPAESDVGVPEPARSLRNGEAQRWHHQGGAVSTFTRLTLRRSPLHQGVLVGLTAIGLGIAGNTLLGAGFASWVGAGGAMSAELRDATVWIVFPLMLMACLAARGALSLPIDIRSNWIFRVTEAASARVPSLAASTRALGLFGVAVPVLLVLPLQVAALGWQALTAAGVSWLCGAVLVEILLRDWARIPFTCSYMPGKGFVPQVILIGFLSFVLFTSIGNTLVHVTMLSLRAGAVLDGIAFGALVLLRRRRLEHWRTQPIEFEDYVPSELHPLKLGD